MDKTALVAKVSELFRVSGYRVSVSVKEGHQGPRVRQVAGQQAHQACCCR
jgi:hypothetical protein